MNTYLVGFSIGMITASIIISVLGFYIGRKSSKKLNIWEKANEDAQRDALNKAYAKGVKDCTALMHEHIELIDKAHKRIVVKVASYHIDVNGDVLVPGALKIKSPVPVCFGRAGAEIGTAAIFETDEGWNAEIRFNESPDKFHHGYPIPVGKLHRIESASPGKKIIDSFLVSRLLLLHEPSLDKNILTVGEQLANQKVGC